MFRTTVYACKHKMCCLLMISDSRLDKKLQEFEAKYSLPDRWLPTDTLYKQCEYALLLSKKEQMLLHIWKYTMSIWKAGQRRMFLLNPKMKYAGLYLNDQLCVCTWCASNVLYAHFL